MSTCSLLFISSSDYDALLAKGVTGMIAERSEGGYFDRVISVHPLARKSRTIFIAPGHDLVEFGFDALPLGGRFRFLRFLYAPFYVMRAVIGVRRLIRINKIDIVRASDPYVASLIGWLGTRATSASFVISIHADYGRHENRDTVGSFFLAEWLRRFMLRRAQLVMPISQYLAEETVALGVARDDVAVIHHGIDLKLFSGLRQPGIRDYLGIPEDKRIVLYVNRLSNQKYCHDALDSAALTLAGDICFVFCGDGPERVAMQIRVQNDPRLKERVLFLGFQSRETIAAIAAEATVGLVLLAGFGLIELSASGLPVIVYDIEWQTEFVLEGKTGFVVSCGNIAGVAEKIDYLLSNLPIASEMGKQGHSNVVSNYSLLAATERRVKAYSRVITA